MNLDDKIFDLQTELCLAMSHPTRFKIVRLLKAGPLRVSAIAEILDLEQSTVSRHLKPLRNAGFVIAARHGQEVIYQIANPKIVAVCDMMRDVLIERELQRSEGLDALQE